MPDHTRWFTWEMRTGTPVTVGDTKLTPQTRTLTLQWPHGGFVWNHPVAVLIERGGMMHRYPIPDVTLVAVLAIVAFAAASGFALFLVASPPRRKVYE